jgi:hypothetical protein
MRNIIFIWPKLLELTKIWFKGGIFWPLHSLWHNLHMFLDILKFWIEKKIIRENCFGNVVSEILKRTSFYVFFFFFFSFRTFFLKVVLWTHRLFSHKSETTFSKLFFLKIFLNFLFLTLGCLETCTNCVTKCVTAKIYPLKIQFYKFNFLSHFRQLMSFFIKMRPYNQKKNLILF